MKTLIFKAIVLISLIVACGTSTIKAQDFKREGKVFSSVKKSSTSDDVATPYTWKDSKGVEYPISLHKVTKGDNAGKWKAYVVKKSAKTGKEYKYYIPSLTMADEIAKEMGL